jgi:hypothetical protein
MPGTMITPVVDVMWLVLKPTVESELADCCWGCDWPALAAAFRGGLDGREVFGLYRHKWLAQHFAQSLLDVRDGKLDASAVSL